MKKVFLNCMLLLCALIVGSSSLWATEGDILNETFADGLPTGWSADAKGGGSTTGASTADSNGHTDSKCWKLGTNSNPYGSITTSALSISGDATLTFWTKAKNTKAPVLLVTATNCTLTGDYNATSANNNTYKEFTVNITNVTGPVTLTFKHNSPSGGSYIYLDDIVITSATPTKVATPVISGDAKFLTSTTITITCATDGAAIQYTTNNGVSWTNYSTSFDITATTTMKAKATDPGAELDASDVSDAVTFTKVTPMTVVAAKTYIDAGVDLEDQFVSGIVSQVDEYSSTYNSITYWISDDGTTSGQMEVYGGKGLDNANFSAITDLEVGDKVIVRGTLKKYQEVYEFGSGNYLMSLVEILDNDLTKSGDINLSAADLSTTADASDYFTTSSMGTITYESGNTSIATVSPAGVVTPVAVGMTTITVSQAATATYKAGEITINVSVVAASLNPTTIAANASGSTVYGTPKVEEYMIDDTYDGTVAAVSSNTAVATVVITQPDGEGNGTFTITPVAVGSAVITISAPATATCEAADDVEYTITVNAPAGSTEAMDNTSIFEETFDKCNSSGGNDGNFATAGSTKITNDNMPTYCDNTWTFSNVYIADQCIKLGGGSALGRATTPALGQAGDYTITFKAAAWNGNSEKTTLKLSANAGTLSHSSVTIQKGAWDDFVVTIINATAATKITFEGQQTSNSRFFLDEVEIKSGLPIQVALNADGYATFCSEYPLDFSSASGYTAWYASAVEGSTITFEKITGSIKGGQGILLKGDGGATVTLNSVDSDVELDDNMLVGCLAPTYVGGDAQNYALVHVDATNETPAHSEFQNLGSYNGIMPAGKAYLRIPGQGQAPSAFRIIFEENNATDINSIEESDKAVKFIENGQLYIMRNGVVYDAVGRLIRK